MMFVLYFQDIFICSFSPENPYRKHSMKRRELVKQVLLTVNLVVVGMNMIRIANGTNMPRNLDLKRHMSFTLEIARATYQTISTRTTVQFFLSSRGS